ncbi:hypothetical protein SteCoe_36451 [Stentor coeruleus]|uniref:EGF-like domain-containing protein n=1 Tax=Stentor coeruleus TaxID=5963 RepID=A0A1R2AQ27_9CILI|nr:hypothetical protein SteCoe_36451 [Stentor coeruleus]
MRLQLILSLLSLSSGATILNYHFAEDYGQIIHDYSLNGNDAVNGASSETTSYDTVATDRGAYFKDTTTTYITLPPNDIIKSGFSLGNSFSIVQWALSFDSYDEYLSYRTNSDSSQYFYTKRGFANNVYQGKIRTAAYDVGQKSGTTDLFYKENWMFIAIVVSGTSVVFHMNELQQFTFTLSSSYSESGSFNHYIGYTSNSFQGFVWTYQIYDTAITTTDYFSTSYSTGNCLVDDCPASCSPGIKWNSLTYCISQLTNPYLSGDYHNCPSSCSGLGCTNNMICYNCACASKKCHMSSSSVISCNSCSSKTYTDSSGGCKSCNSMCLTCSDSTYCLSCIASHTQLISGVCSCSDGYYASDLSVSDGCQVCDTVCKTCPDATHCTTCITDNAQSKSSGGCECKTGFYASGSFTLTNSCSSCHSDCKTCTVQNLCTTCNADHATASTDAGCKCIDGYYKIKDLSNQDACSLCFNECKTCDDGVKCTSCVSSHASPDTTSGCKCNSGYYASSTLNNANACSLCSSECKTCTQAIICDTCVADNAVKISTGGCKCGDGFYASDLTVSDGCKVCDSVCKTCPDATHCTTCVTDNAQSKSSGGCECKTGFYASGSFTLSNSCSSCHSDCKACTTQNLCTTCNADHATARTDAGCECIDGYYKAKDLSNQDACSKCSNQCQTCNDGVKCTACISSYASPDTTSGCKCNSGYYASNTLDNANACTLCSSECKTCSEYNICDTCVTDNAIPLSTGGCECEDGFYATGLYTSQNSCTSCYTECKICSGPNLCDTCKADNASPREDIGCECNVGHYKSESLSNQNGCSLCYSECSSCNQANKCLTCIAAHSTVNSDIGCKCINGYYSPEPLISQDSCQVCYEECSECSEANKCIKCIAKKSMPDEFIGCKCIDGYYSSGPLTSTNSCILCSDECKTCEQELKCTSCIAENAIPSKQNGCKCKQGFFGTDLRFVNSCQACNSACKTCNQTEICIQCADNFVKNSTGHCNEPCNLNEYAYLGGCLSCQNLCLTCSEDECLTCTENAYLKNKKCYCNKGFEGTKDCNKLFFNAKMSISDSNLISLIFDEVIEGGLLEEDFLLYFDYKEQLSYNFSNNTKKTYYFKVNIINTLPEGIKVYLSILKNDIRSSSGSFLENYNFTGNLHYYKVFFPSNEITSSSINATKSIVIFCASASIASGLFNNPSTAWVFINTLELLTYLPLGSVSYTENLVEFFTFLGGISIVPNPSEIFFTITNQSTPYKEARNYGFKTSYFIINSGPIIGSFIAFICLIPVCYFGSKLKWGKFAVESSKILLNYRYSFFVRFWVQSYLSLGILSLVQIKSEYEWNSEGLANIVFSSLTIIIVVITPVFLLIAGFLNYKENKHKCDQFKKKWGSIYEEFKNNKGFISTQFYTVFLIRRIGYIFSQAFLNYNAYMQLTVILIFSIIQLLFLVFYLPYKDKEVLVSSLIGEFCIIEVIILSYFFLPDIGLNSQINLESAIVFSVLIAMILQTGIAIVLFVRSLKEVWQKLKILRSKFTLKNIFKKNRVEIIKNHKLANETRSQESDIPQKMSFRIYPDDCDYPENKNSNTYPKQFTENFQISNLD